MRKKIALLLGLTFALLVAVVPSAKVQSLMASCVDCGSGGIIIPGGSGSPATCYEVYYSAHTACTPVGTSGCIASGTCNLNWIVEK